MMRSWIHFTRGRFVRQARVGLGELREEHLSRQGFAGPVAMLYRTDGLNAIVRVEGDYRARWTAPISSPAMPATRAAARKSCCRTGTSQWGSAGAASRCPIATAT